MNDAKIRIHADLIAGHIQTISAVTVQLRRSYNDLYDQLQSADPQHDRQFEYFMLHLTRTLHALQSDHINNLAIAAKSMRAFASASPCNSGAQSPESAPSAIRQHASTAA